jgi:tRNA(Ile)-lysidine synthase
VIFEYRIDQSSVDSGKPTVLSEINARIRLTRIQRDEIRNMSGCNSRTAFFDWDRLQFPLIVRNVRPGDRFSPLGARGTQKLKKFFIDHKIPLPLRARCPVLLSENRIIWVMGLRIDERFKVTPTTKKILKIELRLAEPVEGN